MVLCLSNITGDFYRHGLLHMFFLLVEYMSICLDCSQSKKFEHEHWENREEHAEAILTSWHDIDMTHWAWKSLNCSFGFRCLHYERVQSWKACLQEGRKTLKMGRNRFSDSFSRNSADIFFWCWPFSREKLQVKVLKLENVDVYHLVDSIQLDDLDDLRTWNSIWHVARRNSTFHPEALATVTHLRRVRRAAWRCWSTIGTAVPWRKGSHRNRIGQHLHIYQNLQISFDIYTNEMLIRKQNTNLYQNEAAKLKQV